MASYNKVILMGNLTQDPQLSYLPSQMPVCEIRLAINHRWRTQDGQQKEDVCFIDCRAFGKQAEILNQYMRKGRSLLVEGRLQYDQWEAQDGQKRSKHRVFIERFSFLGAPQGEGQGGGYAPAPRSAAPPATHGPAGPAAEPPSAPGGAYDEIAGEDIPF